MNNSIAVDQLNGHIRAGNTDAAIALLSSGVPLDEVGSSGRTPLMAAAFNGNMDVVRALIQSGANVSMQGSSGLTALHDAASEGHSEIVDLLLNSTFAFFHATRSFRPSDPGYFCHVRSHPADDFIISSSCISVSVR